MPVKNLTPSPMITEISNQPEVNQVRDTLIHDLYQWGPALAADLWAKYPAGVIQKLVREKVIGRRKFTGFEVYLLTGAGLRSYGYSFRYNYVPARNVILGTLIVRAMARQYATDGYSVELYDGYAQRGRDNILLARRNGELTAIVGRASLTLKAIRIIASALKETFPDLIAVHAVILEADHEINLLNASTVSDLPFTLFQVPLTRITKEDFSGSVKKVAAKPQKS